MFDVGFSEMIVIAVVALIVIGPEKLPRVARTVGALIGRMQRYVNDVKADINREIELDELKKMHTSVKEAAQSIHETVKDTISSFESHGNELNAAVSGEASAGQVAAPEGAAPAMTDAELTATIQAAGSQAMIDSPAAGHEAYSAPATAPVDTSQGSLLLEPAPIPAPAHASPPLTAASAADTAPRPSAPELVKPAA